MRVDSKRFGRAARAAVCAAALALAALTAGCFWRGSNAPAKGAASTTGEAPATNASLTQPTQPASTTPTPAAERVFQRPPGYVHDFAGVIDASTRERLDARLGRLYVRTKIEIAVVTVETTDGRSIDNDSLALARGWGIGPPAGEEGGGVLLLLAVKDRKWRVQVTRSLEPDLPDKAVGEIGSRMAPALREGRYGDAVTGCVDGLIKRLAERRGFSEE